MARLARCTVPGYPHHVLQRGNYDQRVFEEDADYRRYLDLLKECSSRYQVEIWAYCLMPNHVHVICVPNTEEGLARAFNTLHMRYAQYFNGKHSQRGHLWRARFMSCVLDAQFVREEIRFVENNPVRGGLVELASNYPWSSAFAHSKRQLDRYLDDGCFLLGEFGGWQAYLSSESDDSIITQVRANLRTGRPAGGHEFIALLEEITGRSLEKLPRGRPKKRLIERGAN